MAAEVKFPWISINVRTETHPYPPRTQILTISIPTPQGKNILLNSEHSYTYNERQEMRKSETTESGVHQCVNCVLCLVYELKRPFQVPNTLKYALVS